MLNSIIEKEKLLLVTDVPGYSPNISRLICMMNYSRFATLHSVSGLSVLELDHRFDDESNSIGALLLHMAAVDFYYQKFSFEERELSPEERAKWDSALDLGESARREIKGNDLNYYINTLNEIRSRTYELMKEKDDEWLEKKSKFGNADVNNYWMWFHVFEDEINHRGQISWLRKRLPPGLQ
ncbi:MAG: DUF664 domain-containing protein [Ignavibacteria bacterium]|nr:DUF664 domain-containing protein [Ignavibacteria bacterium]